MRLRKLEVINRQGAVLELPLGDISGGFIVKDIQGLGPVRANLVSSSFANMDGAQYHSSRRDPRNIVIKLGLEPNFAEMSVQQLRAELYRFLMPKSPALVKFNLFNNLTESVLDQNLDVEIQARVESNDPAMFSKDPEIDISLICFEPDFVDPVPVIFEGETTSTLDEAIHTYKGNTETGGVFTLLPDRAIGEFSIYHRTPEDVLKTIDFSYPLLADDVLKISSVKGSKYVTLLRDGVVTSVLWAVSPQSAWLELEEGDNGLRVYAAGDPIPFELEYTTKYGGL